MALNAPNAEKIRSLREQFSLTENGQKIMTNFIDVLRRDVGDKGLWEETCRLAEAELEEWPVNQEMLQMFLKRTGLYIDEMPPGHDKGHFYRDLLTSIELFETIRQDTRYKSEAYAGLIAGAFHDIGTVIIPRHTDKDYGASHSEAGAYIFWQLTEGLLGENTRKLICYGIAAHSNYQQPIKNKSPEGYERQPYWNEVWSNEDGKLIGAANAFAQMADRVDIHSPSQVYRNQLAQISSVALNEGGNYISGGQWVGISEENIEILCSPALKSNKNGQPTTLEHSLRFVDSLTKPSVYNQNDHYFPKFLELITKRAAQVRELAQIVSEGQPELIERTNLLDISDLKKFFYQISLSWPEKFEIFWKEYQRIWENKLTPEDRKRWLNGLSFARKAYKGELDLYEMAVEKSEFARVGKQALVVLRNGE